MARAALVNDVRKDPTHNPVKVRGDVNALRQMIRRAPGQDIEPLADGEGLPRSGYVPLNAWDEGIRYWLPAHAARPIHDVPQRSYGHRWDGPSISGAASCSRCGVNAQGPKAQDECSPS